MIKMSKTRPPLRYPGSKYRAFKYLKPFIDTVEHEEYREPFFGSGGVFFQKNKSKYNWLNDLDEELINFYLVIKDPLLKNKIKEDVLKITPSKENFDKIKATNPEDSYSKALKYFIINRTAYSGIMNLPNWGFHKLKSVQPEKWPERIELAHNKLCDTEITSFDYEKILDAPLKGKSVLFFLDPPYFKADQKRAYVKSFNSDDHSKLCQKLKNLKYPFILTYDNCTEIKEMYSWANIYELEWKYHTANSTVTTRKNGKELIITNF